MSMLIATRNGLHRMLYASVGFEVTVTIPRGHGLSIGEPPEGTSGKIVVLSQETTFQIRTPDRIPVALSSLGGPFVDPRSVRVQQWHGGRKIQDLSPWEKPIVPAYGPGTQKPTTPTSRFHGIGRVIDRDDSQVTEAFARATTGDLWVRPGFASTPSFREWSIGGGKKIVALLCQSVDVPGGFVLLEPADVISAYGYPRTDVTPEDLIGLVPAEPLSRLVSWAEEFLSGEPESRQKKT